MGIAESVINGDVRNAARLMRQLDDRDPRAIPVLAELYPHTGKARIIGITGSPGAGKSTLIDGLIQRIRAGGGTVGIVAVDPSSPFTGGAILGDRVRMQRHATDPGVFIRSLATRGRLGGLSASAGMVAQVLDAMGFDRIIIETVGVGQDEVDIVRHADVTVVVVSPGQGDEVQAHKAGVLEIADVLAVNKADLAGVDKTVGELTLAIEMAPQGARKPLVMRCVATDGTGVGELLDEIERLLDVRSRDGKLDSAVRTRSEALVFDLVMERVGGAVERLMKDDGDIRETVAKVYGRRMDPYRAAGLVIGRLKDLKI
ncbi:MAG: methylmalonyl Co-A mutase-associated GTPase MeaB [Deltaproteobacteria bacterium]|nr:methylmalonyl Co-A mutase-associated GTPase MeaB [Deltaproteobacteria bacterium]